jgi:hypothetical protein
MAEICKWKFFKRFEYKKRKKKKNPCGREKGCGRGRETTNFFLDIINKMYCTVVMRQSIYTVNIPLPSAYPWAFELFESLWSHFPLYQPGSTRPFKTYIR